MSTQSIMSDKVTYYAKRLWMKLPLRQVSGENRIGRFKPLRALPSKEEFSVLLRDRKIRRVPVSQTSQQGRAVYPWDLFVPLRSERTLLRYVSLWCSHSSRRFIVRPGSFLLDMREYPEAVYALIEVYEGIEDPSERRLAATLVTQGPSLSIARRSSAWRET